MMSPSLFFALLGLLLLLPQAGVAFRTRGGGRTAAEHAKKIQEHRASSSMKKVHHDDAASLLSFSAFVSAFGRNYKPGSPEYESRQAIFEKRKAAAEQQNRKPGRIWTAGLNDLSDWTDAELRQLRGYTGLGRRPGSGKKVAFLSSSQDRSTISKLNMSSLASLPASKSWEHLAALNRIRDQGACGSCWAIASARLLEAYSEIQGEKKTMSVQQLLACVPNPKHCGGEGGCEGATFDLALDYAYEQGKLSTDEDWGYNPDAVDSAGCPLSSSASSALQLKVKGKKGFGSDEDNGEGEEEGFGEENTRAARTGSGFGSYTMLPTNSYAPLMQALYESGPVGVSVAAGPWQGYSHGIFDGCDGDSEGAIVDHAVVLIAYGEDEHSGTKFWKLLNSWGPSWGESGHIRLLRVEDDDQNCREDTKPEVGSACEPYPESATVCGQCGILYEPVAPKRSH